MKKEAIINRQLDSEDIFISVPLHTKDDEVDYWVDGDYIFIYSEDHVAKILLPKEIISKIDGYSWFGKTTSKTLYILFKFVGNKELVTIAEPSVEYTETDRRGI